MNNSTIHFSSHTLEQALKSYTEQNWLVVCGFLSRKKEGVVVLVAQPTSRTPDHKWIIRISHWCQNHRTYQFGKTWHDKDRAFLPAMTEPAHHQYKCRYFVIEQYEFIGTPPDATEINHNGEVPSSSFTDLFQFVVDNGMHKSIKYLYSALCGLVELHEDDWYHLDFSLENIACGENGRGVLLDFEASSQLSALVPQREVARSFKTVYAAPEVGRGEALVQPSGVDVWAFGVALYLTVTQDYPFSARDSHGKIDQRELFKYVADHGFMGYLLQFKPKFADKIREYPLLAELLGEIFVVYSQRFSEHFPQSIYSPAGKERLTALEIRDHAFWEPYLQGEVEKPLLASVIVAADSDCQLAPEHIQRGASWWAREL